MSASITDFLHSSNFNRNAVDIYVLNSEYKYYRTISKYRKKPLQSLLADASIYTNVL